uniref:hypothetical protein n=1 Tax=Castellaniella defragrans TaxID=75697 RepID=UPI0033421BCC
MFRRKITREFKSNLSVAQAVSAIRDRMVPLPLFGIERQDGILGTANSRIVRLGYLHRFFQNSGRSVFVGKFSEHQDFIILSGYYRLTPIIYFFLISLAGFAFLFFMIITIEMILGGIDAKSILFLAAGLVFFPVAYLFFRMMIRIGKEEDQPKIDAVLEDALSCKVKIIDQSPS